MAAGGFRFDRFRLDPADRLLTRDGLPVEMNGRYLDALILLVREQGKLVSKERFFTEVWRGVPVTDEALTQCIRTLRRQLGDQAGSPTFIETVPKHGYRFIAPVTQVEAAVGEPTDPSPTAGGEAARVSPPFRAGPELLLVGGAGTLGAGLAGAIGGLFYGFVGAAQPLAPGTGAISLILVLTCITILMALLGGAGVSFGIASATRAFGNGPVSSIAGGAAGGLIVGGIIKLIGLDAFSLLLGHTPGDITGAGEGALLGGAVGLAAWLVCVRPGRPSVRTGIATAAVVGAVAGILIALLGGRLMAGSLHQLAGSFPSSRVRLDQVGALVGEAGFGPLSQMLVAGLEGMLFAGCVVGAMLLVRRRVMGRSARA